VLSFYANRARYARVCENRTMPFLHCNGKCQLAKKLRQEEKKDQQNPERKLENKNEVIFFSETSNHFFSFSIHGHDCFSQPVKKVIDLSFPVFHPPAA